MNNKFSTIIIETNNLNKSSWSDIYFIINSIEKKEFDKIPLKSIFNIFYVANSIHIKRIQLPRGIKITNTNIDIINESDNCDFLIIYNKNNSNRNFSEFIPFLNLIDNYKRRISLGININGIDSNQYRERYYFSISQFLNAYSELKNFREDEQIYFIKKYEIAEKNTGQVVERNTAKIASKKEYGNNVSTEFSSLINVNIEIFYQLFNAEYKDNIKNEDKSTTIKYIIESIKKYNEEFNKFVSRLNKKKDYELLLKNYNVIMSFHYKNLFSEYLIKALFFHLTEFREFSDIKDIRAIIYLLGKYSDGIEELIENIIYHTDKKSGCFYFAFNKFSDIQNECIKQSSEKISIERILEIFVYDFSEKGILDTFNREVNLYDLFNTNKLLEEDTHLDLRYAAHTGLKIFQKHIINNLGYYSVETNNASKNSKIKYEYSHNFSKPRYSELSNNYINGTHFEILLPISEQLVKDLPPDNLITYQSKPLNYNDWLNEKDIEISCIQLPQSDISEPSSKEEQLKLIEDIGKRIISQYKDKLNIAFDFQSMGIFKEARLLFKLLAFLQLRTTHYFKIIIISNIPNTIVSKIKDIIENYITAKQKIWNNHTALVLITERYAIPYILNGKTSEEITLLNKQLRTHYPSINYFDFSSKTKNIKESKSYSSKFIQPYELIVNNGQNNIFENYVSNILDNDIENEKIGFKLKVQNILLGSKIITRNFYEADTLFQNSFFVDRFAFLIAKQILDKNPKKELILLGYGLYSEFLVNTIKSFLESSKRINIAATIIAKNIENNEWIIRGKTKEIIEEKFNDYVYATIVPIGSTLSTNDKIISRFIQYLEITDSNKSDHISFIYNVSVILVRDNSENKNSISENESIYWKSIQDKAVKTNFSFAKKVHYLIEKSGNWNKLFNELISFPQEFYKEKSVIKTKNLSVNSYRAIGWPKVKEINKHTFNEELKRLKSFENYTYIHHFDWNKSHLHYYFATESYVNNNKEDIKIWLKEIKKNLNTDFIGLNVIITPNINIESSFVKIINKELFDNTAFIIYIDIFNDIRNNINHKYSFLKKIERKDKNGQLIFEVKFHFVDHVLSTGESARKARSYVSSIMGNNRPFENIITLINRLSYYRNKEVSGYKDDAQNQKKIVYEYLNLFIPPIKSPEKDCSICLSIKRYKDLKEKTSIATFSNLLNKKINNLETVSLNFNDKKYLAINRNFERFILTHKIFYDISSLLGQTDYHNKIGIYLSKLGKSDNILFKINFVKVLSTQPLSNYQHIKSFIFTYMLEELNDIFKDNAENKYKIVVFNFLLVLLKHLSVFEANALIRKDLIINVWDYYFNFLKRIDINKEIKILDDEKMKMKIGGEKEKPEEKKKETLDLFSSHEIETKLKELNNKSELYTKVKKNIIEFNILFHLFVDTVTRNDEGKSLWLGDILRTGKEELREKGFKLSKTIENNELFKHFDKFGIDIKLVSKYKNFLVWIGYDNTIIIRKAVVRFEDELKKNHNLRAKFYQKEGENENLIPFQDFILNINYIRIEFEEIIKKEYYHHYIKIYLSLDSPPVLTKLIQVLYAKLLFKEMKESFSTKELTEKVVEILEIFTTIMEAQASFMVMRKPNEERYKIISSYNIDENNKLFEIFKKHFNFDSYTAYQLKNEKNYYPIVSNDTLIDDKTKMQYGEKEYLKFNSINVFRLYNSINNNNTDKPFGAITFLYKKKLQNQNQSFLTYSKTLGSFLILLKTEFNKFIAEAYNKHSITEIINNIYNQEKFERIYTKSNHYHNNRVILATNNLYKIINSNLELINQLSYTFLSLADTTISWLYSMVEMAKGKLSDENEALKANKTFKEVFNNNFLDILKSISKNSFKDVGALKITGFTDIANDYRILWKPEILRTFVIQLIKNAFQHIPLEQSYSSKESRIVSLIYNNHDRSIMVKNNFPGINEDRLRKEKERFDKIKDDIVNKDTEGYSSTTLTSLQAFCEFYYVDLDFGFDESYNFIVKFNIKRRFL